MGVDLRLLPVDGDHGGHLFFSHMIISLDRNAIIGAVREVAEKHAKEIPSPLSCYVAHQEDGEGYGHATEDPYGDPLTFVLAKHLKPLAPLVGLIYEDGSGKRPTAWDVVGEMDDKSPRGPTIQLKTPKDGYQSRLNRAAFAYILALPDDVKIVLYWH